MTTNNSKAPAAAADALSTLSDFEVFPRYAELTQLLHSYAACHPSLVQIESMGRSHEGRDIWVAIVTNQVTGQHADKPAFWADGNIHAIELTGCTAVLHYLDKLVTSHGVDADTTRLLDTRTLYLCPRLNPDGAELALADKPRYVRSSTRPYPELDAPLDGLTVEDVDGDGRVLSMRIPDVNGSYKKHAGDPRLMVPREPGDYGGAYYRVIPEGSLSNYDGFMVKIPPVPEGLDLNRNFPSFWRPEREQKGAGDYPASEPEVKAMVDFVLAHRNIGAAISYHTFSGVILRPMGTMSDDDMLPEDLWTYQRFSTIGTALTGYPAVSVWHEFKYHPKEVVGGTQDWLYEQLGALYWVVELWGPNQQARLGERAWIDWYREHTVEDDLKLLNWSDEQCQGLAYADWKPFRHPQLGEVEIGGWDLINFWRNPPPGQRQREVARFPAWMTCIALSLPRLELLHVQAELLASGVWKVRFGVFNSGWLPTQVTKLALQNKAVRDVLLELHLPAGNPDVSLAGGQARVRLPQLMGHAPKASLLALKPDPAPTADRAIVEWVVRAPPGTTLHLSARADRAGIVRAELVLE